MPERRTEGAGAVPFTRRLDAAAAAGHCATNVRDRCDRPRRRSPGSVRTRDTRSDDRPLSARPGRHTRGRRAQRRSMRGRDDGPSRRWECRAARRRGGAKAGVGPDLRRSDRDGRRSLSRRWSSRLRRHGRRHGIGRGRSRRRLRRLDGNRDRRLRMQMRMGYGRRRRADLSRLRRCPGAGRSAGRIDRCTHRKQRLGVHVALLVGRDADAEVDVRLRPVGLAARADGGHGRPLGDRIALANPNRAEMLQRHGVTVRSADRERPAALRHGSGKRDRAGRRSPHVRAQIAGDVDAAMLAACVRIAPEDERTEDTPVDRPRPGLGGGRHETGHDKCEENGTAHRTTPCSRSGQHPTPKVA